MKKRRLLQKICVIFIVCFLLTPTIKIPGFIGIRLDDLLAFAIAGYFLISIGITRINVNVPLRAMLLFIFFFLLLISITSGLGFDLPTNILDLTKYIWLTKMLIIYLVFYNFIYVNGTYEDPSGVEVRRDYLLNIIVGIAVISALICFSQFINPFGINKYYVSIIAPTQFVTLVGGYGTPRVVGMIGNPNAQGYLMALSLLVSIFLLFKAFSVKGCIKTVIIAIAMFMTLSRTSLVSFIVGFLIIFLLYKKNKKFIYWKFLSFILLFFLFGILFVLLKENETIYNLILWRFETLSNISEDKSFLARFPGWIINLEYFEKSPVFGVGPLARGTDIFGASDNEWLYFLRAYGAVGTVWLVLFFYSSFLFFKRTQSISEKNYSYFSFSILVLTSVYIIPGAVFTSSSLNSLFIVLLATKDKTVWNFSNGRLVK